MLGLSIPSARGKRPRGGERPFGIKLSTVLLGLAFLASACQPGGTGAPQPTAGEAARNLAAIQEFRFNLGQEPPGLDPQYTSVDSSIAVLRQLFDGLLRYDQDLKLGPSVALEVPSLENGGISADLKTYTFRLRSDVKWSDGQPLTAADFEFGIRRLFDPDKGSPYASFYFEMVGGKDYFTAKGTKDQPKTVSEGELTALRDRVGVKAVDDRTLQVQLLQPRLTFLQLSALWPFYPIRRDAIERNGDRWTEAGSLVGNGPFKMTEWVHQDHITLVPNENYYGPKATLTKLTLGMVSDDNAAYAAYLNGETEGVRVPLANVPAALGDPALTAQLRRAPRLQTAAFQFNVKRAPFDNKDVRQALSQSVNREVFVQAVQRGVGKPAYSWIPPGMPGYQEDLGRDVNKFDPAAAKQLLARAGYPNGAGLPPITFQYANTGDNPLRAQFLQGQLKDNLGIDITLEPTEAAAFSRLVNANQHHMAFRAWTADYPDPDNWLPELFGTGAGNNHSQYSSAQFDDVARRAAGEADPGKRLQLWAQAQEIVVKDVPMIFLIYTDSFVLFKPSIQGLKFTGMDGTALPGSFFMNEVWLSR